MTGAILAGGRSTRFGGAPKGLARVGGVRIVDRVASSLRAVCDDLVLVANAPDAGDWLSGARVIADARPGFGALGGLHAALAHARGPVLVVAWDMPFVPASLLELLRDTVLAGAAAAMPHGQPLCACYGPGCLTIAEELLDAGERRAGALAVAAGAVTLGTAAVARFGVPEVIFLNVNAAEDLERAAAAALGM